MPSVMAIKTRNIASGEDMLFALPFEVLHDPAAKVIEEFGPADVESGYEPGDEELRQREQIRDVHRPPYSLVHELREIAYRDRQGKVVDDERDHCRDHEFCSRDQ